MYKIDAHNHADWHGHNFEKFIDNMEKNGISKTWLLSWEAPRDDYDPETINVFPLSRASWNELGEANNGPVPFSLGYEYYTKAPGRFLYARDCFDNIHDQLIKKLSLSENILEMIYYINACKLTNTEY